MSRSPRWDGYALTPLSELTERLQELTQRDAVARHITARLADGTYDPARHPAPTDYPPLTVAEHLKVLALGEAIARAVRHPP